MSEKSNKLVLKGNRQEPYFQHELALKLQKAILEGYRFPEKLDHANPVRFSGHRFRGGLFTMFLEGSAPALEPKEEVVVEKVLEEKVEESVEKESQPEVVEDNGSIQRIKACGKKAEVMKIAEELEVVVPEDVTKLKDLKEFLITAIS